MEYKKYTAPYHPSSNGKIEGFHNFLKACLAKHISGKLEWDEVTLSCVFKHLIFEFSSVVGKDLSRPTKDSINIIYVHLNYFTSSLRLQRYTKNISGQHTYHSESIFISFLRRGVKLSYKVHGYKFHWKRGCIKM